MFYSHEILTNRQYGVATIWLVATVGNRSSTRKVTRKAIQEVDVQKACGKIIEPGAPVALRLQGHLLYGVSRVYNQQCSYMLSDLQKIQAHMHIFFTKFGANQLDPEAGQARPENIVIMNDPDFVPDMRLPQFDLDALVANSQATQKTSSQMSPLNSTLLRGSGSQGSAFNLQFDLNHSDSSGPRGASPFGLQGLSSSQKPEAGQYIINQDEDLGAVGNWGMEIDEDGNILELDEPPIVQDEPDLPPLPLIGDENEVQTNPGEQNRQNVDEEGDIVMVEAARLEAGVAPEERLQDEQDLFLNDNPRPAPSRRKTKKAQGPIVDEERQISSDALRAWQREYLENCGIGKGRVGAAQTKANAMLLTFGLGLANIGQNIGVPGMVHPLARDFSGDSLFTTLTGFEVPDKPRGRRKRRSTTNSLGNDKQEERRVRPRLDNEADQQGRGIEDDDVFVQDEPMVHDTPEVGRDVQAAMSDHLSSALRMPWNRGSSAAPGSSIRGSAQKGRIPSSPLAGRSNIRDLVRFSDGLDFGDDGFDVGGLQSQDGSFGELQLEGEAGAGEKKDAWSGFDIEGANFLAFMDSAIRENGERLEDEDFDVNRRWVTFDDVFGPRETPRATAAQAFYHILALATKGELDVQQDGEPNEPFGNIWVGAKLDDAGDVNV
ncbi:Rec8 like protein-domain-containing protein [Daldinia sp. FL1419]|nr:Rec8 like protein-domain-containing protein [Daldinia sp. FL1419]